MGQYVESALFRIIDEATKPAATIDKALKSLLATSRKFPGLGDPFSKWAGGMSKAASEAKRLNAQLQALAKSNLSGKQIYMQAIAGGGASKLNPAKAEKAAKAIGDIGRNARESLSPVEALQRALAGLKVPNGGLAGALKGDVLALKRVARDESNIISEMAGKRHSLFDAHSIKGFGHGLHMPGLGAMAAAGGGFYAVGNVAHRVIESGGERNQERYLQFARGFSPDTMFTFDRAADQISKQFQLVGKTEALRMLREARDKVNDDRSAVEIAKVDASNYQNMSRLLGGSAKETADNVTMLRKAGEIAGKITDVNGKATPADFKGYSEAIMRVMLAEGRSFDANQALQAARMLKSSGAAFSERGFIETYFYGAEAGGGRAGNAINQMVKNLTGKATNAAMKTQSELGLIDATFDMGKNGTVKNFRYISTKDEDVLRDDPLEYLKRNMMGDNGAFAKFAKSKQGRGTDFTLPKPLAENATDAEKAAFEKQSVKFKASVAKFASAIGSNQNAADAMTKLLLQNEELENKISNAMAAKLGADDNLAASYRSIHAANERAKSRIENLTADIGQALTPVAIPALNRFADAVEGASGGLRRLMDFAGMTAPEAFPDHGRHSRVAATKGSTPVEAGAGILGGGALAAWLLKQAGGSGGIFGGIGKLFRGGTAIADIAEGSALRMSSDPLTRAAGAHMQAAAALTTAAGALSTRGLGGIGAGASGGGGSGFWGALGKVFGVAAVAETLQQDKDGNLWGMTKPIDDWMKAHLHFGFDETPATVAKRAYNWAHPPKESRTKDDFLFQKTRSIADDFGPGEWRAHSNAVHQDWKTDSESIRGAALGNLDNVLSGVNASMSTFGETVNGIPTKGSEFGNNAGSSLLGTATQWGTTAGAAAGDAFAARASGVTVGIEKPKNTGAALSPQ